MTILNWIWWLNYLIWDETHTTNRTRTSLSGLSNPGPSDRDEDEERAWGPESVCWELLNDLASQDDNSLNSDLNPLPELLRSPPRTP